MLDNMDIDRSKYRPRQLGEPAQDSDVSLINEPVRESCGPGPKNDPSTWSWSRPAQSLLTRLEKGVSVPPGRQLFAKLMWRVDV